MILNAFPECSRDVEILVSVIITKQFPLSTIVATNKDKIYRNGEDFFIPLIISITLIKSDNTS